MENLDQLLDWCKQTFWRRRDHVAESTGTQQAGLPVVLNSLGKLASSLLTPIVGDLRIDGNLGFFKTAESRLDLNMSSDTYAKFDATAWGLRIGSLSAGHQFIGVGVKKSGADNNYIAETGNNAAVNHRVIQIGYDGSIRFLYAAHAADDATLSLIDQFSIDSDGVATFIKFSAWANLSYTNGGGTTWADYGAPFMPGQFRKVGDLVQLRGLVKRTAGSGGVVANLPMGFRPSYQVLYDTAENGALARVDITTGGDITVITGGGTYLSLDSLPPFSVI